MTLPQLFLCHHSAYAGEVAELATLLRLRGVVPWVDKERGGFTIGDDSPEEARRVIKTECFGLLLYATSRVFDRWFIREIELRAALAKKQSDPAFVITSFARRLSFRRLSELSKAHLGSDLARFHGVSCSHPSDPVQRHADQSRMATEALRKWLASHELTQPVSLQFSTRQVFPDESNDLLRIDATDYLRSKPFNPRRWNEVFEGLIAIEREFAARFGRFRMAVHGSKHLTAAFLFGRVFARYPLDIRQTVTDVWSGDVQSAHVQPFLVSRQNVDIHDQTLVVQIASGAKNLDPGVNQLLDIDPVWRPSRLILTPADGPLVVDNALCLAMVAQAYSEIERALATSAFRSVHLFVAAPQSFMMLLAQRWAGLPSTYLYEWDNGRYVESCVIGGGAAGANN